MYPRSKVKVRDVAVAFLKMKALKTMWLFIGVVITFVYWSLAGAEVWTLERAISFGLTNSPDVRIALKRIAAAEGLLMQANSALWPKLQLQSTYMRTDNPMMVFGSILNQRAFGKPPIGPIDFNDVPDIDNWNLKGLVTFPIYSGGQIKGARHAAKAYVEAIREEALVINNTIEFEIAQAYYTVIKAQGFIKVAEAALNSFQNNLQIAKKHYENGMLLYADVLDLEVRVAQAHEDLIRARNGYELSLKALQTLLGLESGEIEISEDLSPVRIPESDDYSNRAELAALRFHIEAAQAQLQVAKGGYFPKVDLFASVDHDKGWRSGGEAASYSAGIAVQWNIFDGALTRGKVHEAQANLQMMLEQYRKLRLLIEQEVKHARLKLKEAYQRLEVTQKAVEKAQESVTLTRARYDQGLALTTQLIDAEAAFTGAMVRRIDAEADYRIAVATLRKALGLRQLQ